jgi:hypothetical protein
VRDNDRRQGHAVGQLIDQIRRERQRGRPDARATPQRPGGREQEARPRGKENGSDQRQAPPKERPPRNDKEKEKEND